MYRDTQSVAVDAKMAKSQAEIKEEAKFTSKGQN